MQQYRVTCLGCKKSDTVMITQQNAVIFEGGVNTHLLSARMRADGKWGFECLCGADTRLCREEIPDFDKLVYGSAMKIIELKNMLSRPQREQFRMESI